MDSTSNKLQLKKQLQELYTNRKVEEKILKSRTQEEIQKEYENKTEKLARNYIELLVFPSLEKVIRESKELNFIPKAYFTINEFTRICKFFCGFLDWEGFPAYRHCAISEKIEKFDPYILLVMSRMASEYGLLVEKKEDYTGNGYSVCFWVELLEEENK